MSAGSLHIQRHVLTCRAYGAPPGNLDSAVQDGFGARLGAVLEGMGARDGYWLIRRIEVSATVGSDWSPGQVAEAIAEDVVGSVDRALERGTTSGSVLWFPSRDALLSTFLVDVADGRCSGRWEYDQFGHLLSPRENLLSRLAGGEPLLAALLGLTAAELERVVWLVDPASVPGLLRDLAGGTAQPSPGPVLAAVRRLASTGRMLPGPRAAIVIAISAAQEHGGDFAALAGPALDVAGVLTALAGAGSDILSAIREARWGDLRDVVDPDAFLPLVQWDSTDRAELCDLLSPQTVNPSPSSVAWTSFGAMFLLIPLLEDLWDWERATARWPDCHGVPAVRSAKLLTLATVLGRGRTTSPITDPILRLALDIPDHLDLVDIESWLASIDPDLFNAEPLEADRALSLPPALSTYDVSGLFSRLATSLLAELARRLPGMSGSSSSYLWENLLDCDARVTIDDEAVIVDLGHPPLHMLLSMARLNHGRLDGVGGERRWTVTLR
ncbi:MAG: hypothetical protein ABI873_15995 [Marmoricola sp.]